MKPGAGLPGAEGEMRGRFTAGERIRLAAMGLGVLLLLGALLHFLGAVRARLALESEVGAAGPASAPVVLPGPPVDRDALARETRDATRVDRLRLEPAPLAHLLEAAESLPPEPFDAGEAAGLPRAAIEREPARFRGELFRARGRILSLEAVAADPGPPPLPPHFRGAMRSEEGDLVHFAVLRDSGAARDDFVRLDGIFWKIFEGSLEGAPASAPLLVGRRLLSSVPAAGPVLALDPSLLSQAKDETAGEKERVEEEPYYHLLSFARHGPGDEAEFEAAPELDKEGISALVADPASHRGRPFRLFGRLADAFLRYPAPENAARLEAVDVGWLMNLHTGVARIDAPAGTPARGLRRGDLAWVHGYFLKNHAYPTAGGETRQAPLFVARRVLRYAEPRSGFGSHLGWIALGILGGTGACFLAILRRDRRRAERRRAEIFRRYREQVLARTEPGP
ncbi:MAG: hypothetical protein L0323_12360 [Planctomycetes bacterium]|nr:hypothetical protein [Planctomycetota bacterium]